MYFFNALWYTMSTIGFASIVCFIALLLSVFNEEHIKQNLGYRNYFILIGAYALGALPLAATLNGGTGPDFLFHLGCLCPGLWQLGNLLEKSHLANRISPAPTPLPGPSVTPPGPAPQPDNTEIQRPFAPAPSSLAGDFDVPPQR